MNLVDIYHGTHRPGEVRRCVFHAEAGQVQNDNLLVDQLALFLRLEVFNNVQVLECLHMCGRKQRGTQDAKIEFLYKTKQIKFKLH